MTTFCNKNLVVANYRSKISKIENKNIQYLKTNIKFSDNNFPNDIDAIIHSAAVTPFTTNNEIDYLTNNIKYLDNILNWVIRTNVKKIVFLSSMSVYGERPEDIIYETTIPKNISPYGVSKIKAEKIIINKLQNKNIRYLILRLPGVLGLNSPKTFIPKVIDIIKNNKYPEIFVNNKRSLFNNIISVHQLYNFMNLWLNNSNKSHLLNLASSESIRHDKLIEIISNFYSKKTVITEDNKVKKSYLINFDLAIKNGYIPQSVSDTIYEYLNV